MLGAILSALPAANWYFVTPAQFQDTRQAVVTNAADRFATPSEAAYAACD